MFFFSPFPPHNPPNSADAVLATNDAGTLRTLGAPHVTGTASRCEPGGATFALDIRGTWTFEGKDAATATVNGTYHVPRLVSDPEFETTPVCVDVTADGDAAAAPVAEAKAKIAAAVAASVAGLHQGVQKMAE